MHNVKDGQTKASELLGDLKSNFSKKKKQQSVSFFSKNQTPSVDDDHDENFERLIHTAKTSPKVSAGDNY